MSVITEAYAVPSRLLGVYRYFVSRKGRSELEDTVINLLAPESLRSTGKDSDTEGGGRDMVRKTIREAVAMGLLTEQDGNVGLSRFLLDGVKDPVAAEGALPKTLADLFFRSDCDSNHDLGRQTAWYLAQDVFDAPGNWKEVEDAVSKQFPEGRLGLTNSTPYGNFEDWVCFLGFAWTHVRGGKDVLTPDPTAHLRLRFNELFPGNVNTHHSLPDVVNRLARICPVFEGGFLRNEIERVLPREAGYLSSTTALGLLRLRDEGLIGLAQESDAATMLLPDGDSEEPVSHVVVLRAP
jgi:hypothetical protein